MILVFLGALLDAPGSTARDALVPELAEQAGMPIERATSILQVIERGSRLVGAPLAGLLISLLGTANVLWIDAGTFFISAGIVGILISAPGASQTKSDSAKYFDELADGLRFMLRDKLILVIVIMVMITNFLDSAFGGVILPVYVNNVFGNALNLGLLIAASGGGAVVGGLLFAAIGHRLSRYLIFVAAFVLTSLRFWAFAFFPPLPILLMAVFVFSVGAGPLNPIIGAVEFERIPANMRGRVFGAIRAGAWTAMPLGMLLGGILTEKFGVLPLLIGLGIAYSITTLSMAFIPVMREMDRV